MNAQLIKAPFRDKTIIKNLMQFYMYDFSEYISTDFEEDGLFAAYNNLEDYWKEPDNKFPYVIKKEEKYVGFVLIRLIEAGECNYFSIAEFFIMRKYRRQGIGKAIAEQVFDLHKGQWEVFQKESNKPAQIFWNKVINEYTKGQFKERFENNKRIQDFKN